eukprot:Gb_21254 [translate_table: standard]
MDAGEEVEIKVTYDVDGRILGVVRFPLESTFASVRREIELDVVATFAFDFVTKEGNVVNPHQEERWKVKGKVVGIKRKSKDLNNIEGEASQPCKLPSLPTGLVDEGERVEISYKKDCST